MTNAADPLLLFVDDQPEQVEYHVRALKDDGYQVRFIDTSTTACELCLRNYGDGTPGFFEHKLLILDMMMPPPRNVQLARVEGGMATGAFILGEHYRQYPDTPVLILSNLTERECIDAILRVCKEQLPKTLEGMSHHDLLALLRQHLNVVIHEKRRTPPFRLPIIARGLIGPAR